MWAGIIPFIEDPNMVKKKRGEFSLPLNWNVHLLLLLDTSASVSQTENCILGWTVSQTFGVRWNYSTCFMILHIKDVFTSIVT
jgi:hypothetical protein